MNLCIFHLTLGSCWGGALLLAWWPLFGGHVEKGIVW